VRGLLLSVSSRLPQLASEVVLIKVENKLKEAVHFILLNYAVLADLSE
jgi:hypothetical protein